jgi:glycosyltransferase involved in cell wall biosynthesis
VRVLTIHTEYAFRGGEEEVFEHEARMLEENGHEVSRLVFANADVLREGKLATAGALWRSAFNRRAQARARKVCAEFKPDIAHVHNFWFAASPSVHAACHAEGVATVQTLHNFRLLCAGASLFRGGRPCNLCIHRGTRHGTRHRCYHNSRLQSMFVNRMITTNRRRGTWINDVDTYIALTEHGRSLFADGGLPEEKLRVKPGFVYDPGPRTPPGNGVVFLGRLAPEKGVMTMLEAWRLLGDTPLAVAGEGPMRSRMERYVRENALNTVCFHGRVDHRQAISLIRDAAILLMPSTWYETFGRVIIEAFAAGRPVAASRLGAMAELVTDGRNGRLFEPGNSEALAKTIKEMLADPGRCNNMGVEARKDYETLYTPEVNLRQLTGIYEETIQRFGLRRP